MAENAEPADPMAALGEGAAETISGLEQQASDLMETVAAAPVVSPAAASRCACEPRRLHGDASSRAVGLLRKGTGIPNAFLKRFGCSSLLNVSFWVQRCAES